MYTPTNAPAYYERDVIKEHWPLHVDKYLLGRSYEYRRIFFALVYRTDVCADGRPCNLLDGDYLQRVADVEQYMAFNVRAYE